MSGVVLSILVQLRQTDNCCWLNVHNARRHRVRTFVPTEDDRGRSSYSETYIWYVGPPLSELATTHYVQCPDNLEIASLPTTSPEERKRLLSFVICGGGPTGVETAAVCVGI